ncbi:MAG: CXXX repeat peptide maturase [Chlorobiaceae bacterium]|nr:CXXX repeat peptide maturase [Chlorobiaceae bacterium]
MPEFFCQMPHLLIVILEEGSTSFCHYENSGSAQSCLIDADILRKAVHYAITNRLFASFLYGDTPLPPAHAILIESVEHVKIIPDQTVCHGTDCMQVIDLANGVSETLMRAKALPDRDDSNSNIILRFSRKEIPFLAETVNHLAENCRRVNLVIRDPEKFGQAELDSYRAELESIRRQLEKRYRQGAFGEINVVSDRLFLSSMHNCGAGLDHLTLAPNGRFYLCPAFYYENPENSIGDIASGYTIDDSHLLDLAHAPVCRNCDAYHCKRCIFLNRKLTGELNTPSSQQCSIAHTERNESRKLAETINHYLPPEKRIAQIPAIDYLDPLLPLADPSLGPADKDRLFAGLLSRPLEEVPVKELLLQLYRIDPALLTKLKQRCCHPPDLETN